MPWVIRDVVRDINKAVTKRWRCLDALLPESSDLPEGCMAPLLQAAADDLLTQWRDHLTGQPEASKDDTAAIVNWPAPVTWTR